MKKFLEVVFCKYKDPKIAMWMKNVLVLILLMNFCAGIFYPMENKGMVLRMFAAMIALLCVNCAVSRKRNVPWLDTVTFLLMIMPNLHLLQNGDIGYFSMFYMILFSVGAVFTLGIRTSFVFNAACIGYVIWQFRGNALVQMRELYNENLLLRFPYLYLCIVGIAYIIMFSIQRYWVEKEKNRQILEHRIHMEKQKLADMSMNIITAMYSALSAKIPEVDRHCEQTAAYSREIAKQMGLDETACTNAYYAGLLHEVGAVGLPDEVIQKPSLTDEQYEIYQTYVSRGYKIILELQIADEVAEAVLYHRENYDGSGYLEGLSGTQIPVLSRILSVADYADRHARWGETAEQISEKLEERKGTRFDPECAERMRMILNPEKEAPEKLRAEKMEEKIRKTDCIQ